MCLSIWRAWTKRSAKVGLSPERDLEEASATDAEQIKVEEIGVGLGKFKVEKPNGTSCSEENPEKKDVKILLLGPGQSGKSTFLKQMRIIHGHSYSKIAECLDFRPIINSNLVETLHVILSTMRSERHRQNWATAFSDEIEEAVNKFFEFHARDWNELKSSTQHLPIPLGDAIHAIWRGSGGSGDTGSGRLCPTGKRRSRESSQVKTFYEAHAQEMAIIENASYFLGAAKRICCIHYIPTRQDILQSRKRTRQINEVRFTTNRVNFRMVDVGGQRGQRRKWIPLFDNIDCIIFFAALSGYNLTLEEDPTMNRMKESLRIFFFLTSSPFLANVQMMLFLNKTDLFREKLRSQPLVQCFEDYDGPDEYAPALEHVSARFRAHYAKVNDELYIHYTCSTDTNHIQFVFRAVSDMIQQRLMRHIGLQ